VRTDNGKGGQTEAHREREGNGPQLPSEACKQERMGGWAAIAWLLTKPDAGLYYAEHGPYTTSTLHAEVSRRGES